MNKLTIKIADISDGDGSAYRATIPELNNSTIYADTIGEIFKLIPEAIKEAKKYSFGIYKDSKKQKSLARPKKKVLLQK